MKTPFLCKIGLHKWTELGMNSFLEPLPVECCKRCGIGRKLLLVGAYLVYSKEQMDALITKAKS